MSVNIMFSLFDSQVEVTYFCLYVLDELLLFLNTDVLLLQLVLKVLDLLEELLDLSALGLILSLCFFKFEVFLVRGA